VDGFLLLIWVVLWVAGFVDAIMSDAARVRIMPKVVWVVIIVLFGGIAALLWFIFGRPKGVSSTDSTRPSTLGARFGHPSAGRTDAPNPTGWTLGGAGTGRRPGPLAPDDDPEFLRTLRKRPDEPEQ
jgi:hypothetical protein